MSNLGLGSAPTILQDWLFLKGLLQSSNQKQTWMCKWLHYTTSLQGESIADPQVSLKILRVLSRAKKIIQELLLETVEQHQLSLNTQSVSAALLLLSHICNTCKCLGVQVTTQSSWFCFHINDRPPITYFQYQSVLAAYLVLAAFTWL